MALLGISRRNWEKLSILFVVIAPLLGVLAAIVLVWNRHVFPSDIALLLSFYLCTSLGVTIGYHRMLTHQGFQTTPPVQALFLILGCMAFMGAPIHWAATHICHHAHSDKDGDPHSPLEGFWHAHFGWMFRNHLEDPKKYCPELLKDPVIMFVSRTALFWMVLSLVLPLLLGGWTGFVWGGLVRVFLQTHATWSVNSVCHVFGSRPFESDDESRNEWIVGLLAFGEGWHNNHHAFPRSAVHGLRWWQFDLSALIITGMEKLGLVWDVQRVTPEMEEARRSKADGIRETIAELKEQFGISINQGKADLQAYFATLKKEHEFVKETAAYKKWYAAYQQGNKRLEQLQKRVQKRRSLRKRKLEEYKLEAAELVTASKAKMREKAKKLAAAVG